MEGTRTAASGCFSRTVRAAGRYDRASPSCTDDARMGATILTQRECCGAAGGAGPGADVGRLRRPAQLLEHSLNPSLGSTPHLDDVEPQVMGVLEEQLPQLLVD